jgi:hypothetical protein
MRLNNVDALVASAHETSRQPPVALQGKFDTGPEYVRRKQ